MKKFLKRFLIITGIVIAFILLLAVIITSIFADDIGKRIIAELNKQLTTELTVKDVDMSVISTFPNAAANLNGVVLMGANDDVLLEAEKISFRLSLFSLLSKKIRVKSVVVSNGALTVNVDKRGKANYDIFKSDETPETPETEDKDGGSGPVISLAEARLVDMQLIYQDEKAEQEIMAEEVNASFSGEFSSSRFDLKSKATLVSRFADIGEKRFLPGKKLGYDAQIFVDMDAGKYEFKEVQLEVESNTFNVDGSIETTDESTFFDLFFNSEKSSLADMIKLLPDEYLATMADFESSGDFVVKASLKGAYNDRENPEIKAEINLEDGRITSDAMDGTLKDVSFNATFDNGRNRSNKTSSFHIKDFKGYFNRQLLELSLDVDDLDDPQIDFAMDGIVPVGMVYGFIGDPRIQKGGGKIEVKNLVLKGRYEDMIRTTRIDRVEAGGELEFDDAYLQIEDENLMLDRGILSLHGNELAVTQLELDGPGSELLFEGKAFNVIPVIFADSINSQGAELGFEARLKCKTLDLDRLLKLTLVDEEEASEAAAKEINVDSLKTDRIRQREKLTSFLKGTFIAEIDEYNYNQIEGKDFRGELKFISNEMAITGKTQAMGGEFDLDGNMYFRDEPYLVSRLTCNQVNIKQFFQESENFGQDILTDKNLEGNLDAKIAIYAYWDEKGNFLMDKLRILGAIGLVNGELKDFKMMENFSTFVKIKDLQQIKFTNLQNFFEISNRKIYIPVMFIQSNALNLTVSGEHTFDQEIAYYLKVNAAQVLANRFKSYDPSLKPQKARRKGFFNLHYAILGTVDDFNVKSSKSRVTSDFEQSERRKRDIQAALEKEFHTIIKMVDEPQDWRDIPENESVSDEFLWEN